MRAVIASRAGIAAAAVLAGCLPAAAAVAWPVLGEAVSLHGLRCYPDHLDPALWWYLPQRLELVETDEGPAFRFEQYNYSGRHLSGDRGVVWGRGVVTLRVRLAPPPGAVAAAEAALERRLARQLALHALPLVGIESVLHYVATGPGGAAGELDGGTWAGEPKRWTERDFSVGLSPPTAELLWQAFERGALAMSLGYGLVGIAVPHRPARDPFGGEPETVEPVEVTLIGNALPIRLSPASCPACFAKTTLDAEIPAEYALLETRCYDFAAGGGPADLGLVVLEVRATAVTGDPVIEEVRFEPQGPPTAEVHFALAVSLDAGYSHRVTRVYGDGRTEPGEWRHEPSWSGVLDVTAYRSPAAAAALDARALY